MATLSFIVGAVISTPNIHVLQMGDEAHLKHHASCVASIQNLTRAQNYTYTATNWDKHEHFCAYTAKVATLLHYVKAANNGDWVVWLDADVKYQHPSTAEWEKKFFPPRCEFVVLRTPHTINTGIIHVKATRAMREFVQEWLAEQTRTQHCSGPADQLALQTVFMRHLVPNYSGTCEQKHSSHEKNLCFEQQTKNIKHTHPICTVGCTGGLQRHDCGGCNHNDLFCHHHKC